MAIANHSLLDEITDARAAQDAWQAARITDRLAIVRQFRRVVIENMSQLCEVLTGNTARLRSEVIAAEILPLVAACRFLERRAEAILRPERHRDWRRWLGIASSSLTIERDPLGVILIIAPSNYPLLLPTVQALQALVAGNAVLLKPGTDGSAVARVVQSLFKTAGLPTHLFTLLGEAAGDGIAAIDVGVDKVVLTGSAATGREALTQLAATLTPSVMELSGCDAMFVLEGADLDRVASAIAFSLRLNHGATCMAPRRIYVASAEYATLVERLRPHISKLPAAIAPAHLQSRGEELIEDALLSGVEVLRSSAKGGFAPAILLGDLAHTLLSGEDIFLPVAALCAVSCSDDALQLNRQCHYRLGASVFGETAAAQAFARKLNVGCVTINDVIAPTADPRVPLSGRGESGFGATRGAAGLLEMTQIKALVTRHGRWLPHLDTPQARDADLLGAWLQLTHGRTLSTRLHAAKCLFAAIRRSTSNIT